MGGWIGWLTPFLLSLSLVEFCLTPYHILSCLIVFRGFASTRLFHYFATAPLPPLTVLLTHTHTHSLSLSFSLPRLHTVRCNDTSNPPCDLSSREDPSPLPSAHHVLALCANLVLQLAKDLNLCDVWGGADGGACAPVCWVVFYVRFADLCKPGAGGF